MTSFTTSQSSMRHKLALGYVLLFSPFLYFPPLTIATLVGLATYILYSIGWAVLSFVVMLTVFLLAHRYTIARLRTKDLKRLVKTNAVYYFVGNVYTYYALIYLANNKLTLDLPLLHKFFSLENWPYLLGLAFTTAFGQYFISQEYVPVLDYNAELKRRMAVETPVAELISKMQQEFTEYCTQTYATNFSVEIAKVVKPEVLTTTLKQENNINQDVIQQTMTQVANQVYELVQTEANIWKERYKTNFHITINDYYKHRQFEAAAILAEFDQALAELDASKITYP